MLKLLMRILSGVVLHENDWVRIVTKSKNRLFQPRAVRVHSSDLITYKTGFMSVKTPTTKAWIMNAFWLINCVNQSKHMALFPASECWPPHHHLSGVLIPWWWENGRRLWCLTYFSCSSFLVDGRHVGILSPHINFICDCSWLKPVKRIYWGLNSDLLTELHSEWRVTA